MSKSRWRGDGVGLPVVGSECEVAQQRQVNWEKFKVIAVDSGAVFGFWSNGVASALDGDRWLFRPIRSKADKTIIGILVIAKSLLISIVFW